MKTFFIHILLLLCTFSLFSQEPGMPVEEFKKKFRGIVPAKTTYNETVVRESTFGNIYGKWYFQFTKDTLRDFFYSANLGMKLKEETIASFLSLYNAQKEKELTSGLIVGDTIQKENRARVNNSDTLLFYETKTLEGNLQTGLYYTGNYKVKQSPQDMVSQHSNMAPSMEYFVFTIKYVPVKNKTGERYKYYTGMTITEFGKAAGPLPEGKPGVTGQWQKETNRNGLKGKWTYTFKNDKLDWFLWDHYSYELNQAAFDKTLKATKQIVNELTKKYGPPQNKSGDNTFIDPAKDFHNGYSVLRAEWKLKGQEVVVEFKFTGGKAGYLFVVKEEHTKGE